MNAYNCQEKVITAANNLSDEDYASVLLASIRQFELRSQYAIYCCNRGDL